MYIIQTSNSFEQVIGPEELAAELRAEDPDSMDPVQKALLSKQIFKHLIAE